MRCPEQVSGVLTLAAALLLAGSATSFAQAPSEFEPARLPGWTFTPGVVASAVFDDNVALTAKFANQLPQPQGDQLFTIQPSGQLEYVSPRTTFASGYRGYLRRYADFNELDGFDQHAYATLRHLVTRHVTTFVTNRFIKVPSTDELQLNGVPFSRTGSRNDMFSAGVESRLSRVTDWNVQYDLTWVDFDQSPALLLRSGLFHGVSSELSRRLNDRSALGAEYAVRVAHLDQGTRNLTFQNAGGTFHYDAGPRTALHGSVGLAYLIDHTLNESHTGLYARGDITHHLERATIGASAAREFVPTFGFGGSSQSKAFSAYVMMPVSRNRIYLQQSISWRRSNPLITTTLPLDSWWLHSTVGYRLTRSLRSEAFYTFARQDSNIPGGLIIRNRIGLQLAFAQPMRIQ
jgi:hypothetical protein